MEVVERRLDVGEVVDLADHALQVEAPVEAELHEHRDVVVGAGAAVAARDPDGNGWLFQEITTRLAGRIDSGVTTFASVNDLAAAFRRAEAAHGKYEARLGQGRDANWPEWYAAYMVAEQAGTELPS